MRLAIPLTAALIALGGCSEADNAAPAPTEVAALQAAVSDSEVRRFYEASGWRTAWEDDSSERVVEAIGEASRHGLDPAAFLEGIDVNEPIARDAALSRAVLAYAAALARGRTDPTRLRRIYTLPRDEIDLAAGLRQAIAQNDVAGWLTGLAPQDEEYRALSDAYVQASAQLAQAGDQPPPALIDRARALAVNLERRRWLERTPPATRIDVNTAAAFLTYFRGGAPADRRRVIVGEPGNETPQLGSPLHRLVANPTWTVPRSIEQEEIAPLGEGYMARNNMEWRDGWIVQRSGPNNSLGLVKFDMRNDHSIYLHDTPHKALFQEDDRHRSHGCVRVQDALGFARMIASEQGVLDDWEQARTSRSGGAPAEAMVPLPRPIPVRLLYLTAFLVDGRLVFAEDHYGWDEDVAEALGLPPRPRRAVQHRRTDVGP